MGAAEVLGTGCGGLVCASFITAFVLFVIAPWGYVNYDEYGLLYNEVTGAIADEVYEPGRYYVLVGHSFIYFNRTFTNIEFSDDEGAVKGPDYKMLALRVTDGQLIDVELSFQVRLIKDQLKQMYWNYGNDYVDPVARYARAALRDVAATFNSDDYFFGRDMVEAAMRARLAQEIPNRMMELVGFQLRKVSLPQSLEDRIMDIQLKIQAARFSIAQLEADEIRANTGLVVKLLQTNSANLLTKMGHVTEVERVEIQRNVSLVEQLTVREISKIVVRRTTDVEVYSTHTANDVAVLAANKSVVQAISEQLLKKVDLNTDYLEAAKDAEVATIRAKAQAEAVALRSAADAEAKSLWLSAKANGFANQASALSMTSPEALHFLWIDAIAAHNPARMFFDSFSPTSVYLGGQRESYFNAMDRNASTPL